MLQTIEIETAPNPNAAIVWLHGLGADCHDFEPWFRKSCPAASAPGASYFPTRR